MKPLISVVIASHNMAGFLGEALESIFQQTYSDFEIILVDDGSTDSTAKLVRRYPNVLYIKQKNQGAAAATNNGIARARGEFLAFLDADDLWTPRKLELQNQILLENPTLEMVFGRVEIFRDKTCPLPKTPDPNPVMEAPLAGAMLVRKKAFQRVGGFSPEYRLGYFIDWYTRSKHFEIRETKIPEIVLQRRIHTGNTGIRESGRRSDYARVLKAELDRRREKAKGPIVNQT